MLYEGTNNIQINYKEAYSFGNGSTSAGIQDGDGTGLNYEPFMDERAFNQVSVLYYLDDGSTSNQEPVADAGPDQTVRENERVDLDASGSSDPDNDSLSYSWSLEIEGTNMGFLDTVQLMDADTATPYFTAPELSDSATPEEIAVNLTVTDSAGNTDDDQVVIKVVSEDSMPPVALISADKTSADRGETVTLDGSASYDDDGVIESYVWEQIAGETADWQLEDLNGSRVSVTVPNTASDQEELKFELTVTDDTDLEGKDRITVTVVVEDSGDDDPINVAPVADAGTYGSYESNTVVTLDGSGSTDANGDNLSYSWMQVANSSSTGIIEYKVELFDADTATPYFTAPLVSDEATLKFELTVTDEKNVSNSDTCTVTIAPPKVVSLYFPFIHFENSFSGEVSLINTDGSEGAEGDLTAYNDWGGALASVNVSLDPNGRYECNVADTFDTTESIAYLIFDSTNAAVKGYQRQYKEGQSRAGIEALYQTENGSLYIPYIACLDADWNTYITLVNTGDEARELEIVFNNGTTYKFENALEPSASTSFPLSWCYSDSSGDTADQPTSAIIQNSQDVVGIALYEWGDLIAGVPLSSSAQVAEKLYFPHVPSDEDWVSGLVIKNSSDTMPCVITLIPYSEDGTFLSPEAFLVQGNSSYVGLLRNTGLPEETSWVEVLATSEVDGIELLGNMTQSNYAGFKSANIEGTSGSIPVVETATELVIVNTENEANSVTLTAWDDSGNMISQETLALTSKQKMFDKLTDIFTNSISGATHVSFTSDKAVVVMEMNVSEDGTMNEAVPAL